MKCFDQITFDLRKCKQEVQQLGRLSKSRQELKERQDLLPFFQKRLQLCAFLSTFATDVHPIDRIAFEYPLFGDYTADIVIGNSHLKKYCVIELEDAKRDSIFKKSRRSTSRWGPRFEQGFSQLVDWFFMLRDVNQTERFRRDFGTSGSHFYGLLIIGRSQFLDEFEVSRLRWRNERVLVDSRPISCLTFDDVYDQIVRRLQFYPDPAAAD